MATPFIIAGIIIVVLLVWGIAAYNSFIQGKNRTDEAFSDIDVQLKRRYDLIPNLVESVKGYAKHEASTFEKVTQARNMAMQATGVEEKAQAENMLTGALKSLFAVSESYPELKASQNFSQLQDELSDTENKIQASRRFYNGNARDFNIKLQTFPNNLIAKMFAFSDVKFFEIENQEERNNVAVKF